MERRLDVKIIVCGLRVQEPTDLDQVDICLFISWRQKRRPRSAVEASPYLRECQHLPFPKALRLASHAARLQSVFYQSEATGSPPSSRLDPLFAQESR
jgi:hypothetical protein